ncbi:MAG TPA: response regulator [Flavisolibacter sp.]|jgi:DNA-binding NarL/FixJ family response regulator|nr:response regulator [Flavisolibacter sp.]
MIDKVLIAEDHESANLSVQKTVEALKIGHVDHVYYCDDAIHKIEVAKQKGRPYDLLITDLYFEPDGTPQTIENGSDLIAAVRKTSPEVMILVFSAEQRASSLERLISVYEIDGYVRKARNDAKELKAALETLSKGQRYYPRAIAQLVKQANNFVFTELDVCIIRLLSQGYKQKDIPDYLRENNLRSCSLSTIEKRLNFIREEHGFSKNEQLVLHCKEKGVL